MATATNRLMPTEDPMEQVRQAANDALEKAKEALECVGSMAGHTVSAVGKKADDLTAAAGHEIKSAGQAINQNGPQCGIGSRATHAVGGTLQGSGQYIEDAKLSGIAHDITCLVKNHPVPTVLLCLGLGYFVARALND